MSSRLTMSGSRATSTGWCGGPWRSLNALLDAEADRLCNAQRYERSEARRDTRAGHYERGLQTKAGEEAWRNRPIEGEHPYVYLDGIVLKRSWAGEVRNVSLLVAIGSGRHKIRFSILCCEVCNKQTAHHLATLSDARSY